MIGSSCLFVQILGVIIHSFSVKCFVLFVSLVSFRIGIILMFYLFVLTMFIRKTGRYEGMIACIICATLLR